jgi:glutaredoxin-related protein
MQLSPHDARNRIAGQAWVAVAIGLVVLLMAGCASSQAGGIVSTREILTAEEISKTTALTAYDAIQIRRPAFLAGAQRRALRDADQPDTRPVVYVNGVFYGEVESLRDILVREIKEIRFLEANDATRVLGSAHVGGVILVTTKLN